VGHGGTPDGDDLVTKKSRIGYIGYSGSFGQSFRKVSDTLFAPVQVELV